MMMGATLELDIVAEGVETESQLQFLQARNCDLVQGYLFSPTRPASEISKLTQ